MATSLSQDNRLSTILTETENETIFSLLNTTSKTLSTTLVRLLLSEGPDHRQWQVSCIGIACLVKDSDNGLYFIKIFDFVEKTIPWEHQLSTDVEYKCPEPLLIAFETSVCTIGINFSVEEEAIHFRDTLKEELFKNKPQIEDNLQSQSKLMRKSVSKDDIKTPSNFRHSLRVFFNPLIGFEVIKPNNKESDKKKNRDNSSDNSSHEIFESEDEIQIEEAFQFLNRDNSITSNDSFVSTISNPRPVPKARTKVVNSSSRSEGTQTEQVHTLYSALVNKFFEPINHLTPPPIVKAMTYLASHSDLDQI